VLMIDWVFRYQYDHFHFEKIYITVGCFSHLQTHVEPKPPNHNIPLNTAAVLGDACQKCSQTNKQTQKAPSPYLENLIVRALEIKTNKQTQKSLCQIMIKIRVNLARFFFCFFTQQRTTTWRGCSDPRPHKEKLDRTANKSKQTHYTSLHTKQTNNQHLSVNK
jgi:hypothetical protein